MDGKLLYLDPTAIVKLVVEAPETDALREELARWPERVTSRLSVAEVGREARLLYSEGAAVVAREVLSGLALVNVDAEVLRLAADLELPGLPDPAGPPTLDVIHLATGLSLAGDFGAFVSYDGRMVLAADAAGLNVLVPGASP
ncbi:type II toxin-antitoxin system VapC family toxin [Rubrobacter indicoceani]|uniref:type II toxin-antitoxin system VapC family toxin n=1 Tax=Rubrobacter indicoceani TaxID=2051957 RepID=UPI000E5A2758|nr:type II toxin-antitoxin system VapC family toxin [Rubrobacter indicoceani]